MPESRVEQRVMRIMQGQPIPAGWTFVQWLGTETGTQYAPAYQADVMLVQREVTE